MFNSLDRQDVVDSLMGSCEDYISDVTHPELASDNKACVYWIRPEGCDDIYQGYVGVTKDLRQRLSGHVSAILDGCGYHEDFRSCVLSGNAIVSVEMVGSCEDCLTLEFQLRPNKRLGWNKHEGGQTQHKRSEDIAYRALKRLKNIAKGIPNLVIDEILNTQKGIDEFLSFYDKEVHSGRILVLPDSGLVNLSTIEVTTRSILNRRKNKHEFENGVVINISDLAESLMVKPNTIVTQIRRGWSYNKIIEVNSRRNVVEC